MGAAKESSLESVLTALEIRQRWITWFGIATVFVLTCIAAASEQFCERLGLLWDTETNPGGFWGHTNLQLLAILYLGFVAVMAVLLAARGRRGTSLLTVTFVIAALIYFGGAAVVHSQIALQLLSPFVITVAG